MSEVVTYLLYAVLVVVLALAGRYIGSMYKYPGTGTVVGGLVGVGLAYWHYSSSVQPVRSLQTSSMNY